MKKQLRIWSAALAAGALLAASGAPALAADRAPSPNYTILKEVTGEHSFQWFPQSEAMLFEQDGKYGLKKLDGTIVLSAVYGKIGNEFGNGNDDGYITVVQQGRVGVVDRYGHIILQPEWKSVSYGEGLMTVLSTDNQYGFADYNGKLVIAPQYDDAGTFFRGYASVGKDLKYSYIDMDNSLLVPWQDEEVFTEDGQYFSIDNDETDTCRIIDGTGRIITDGEYQAGSWFAAGKAAIVTRKSDGRTGVIDPQNRTVIPFAYDNIRCCQLDKSNPADAVLAAISGEKVTFFDLDGNQLGGQSWDKGRQCGTTLGKGILIEQNGKLGMIDSNGRVIAEPVYDEISGLISYCDLVFLQTDGKTGMMDTGTGELLVEPRWQPMGLYQIPPDEAYVTAQVGDWETALLNGKGQVVIAPDEIGGITSLGNGYLYLDEYNLTPDTPNGDTGRKWLARINDTIVPRDPSVLDAGDYVPDDKVQYLLDRGILRGDADGSLHLYDRVTRAEFVALLSRAENWNLTGVQAGSFSDVPAAHWAAQAVEKAAEFGIVNGVGGGRFDPDGWVTEGQALTILSRRAGYAAEVESAGALETAEALGLTDGLREYGLYDPASRLTACHMLYNYLHMENASPAISA